MAVPLDQAIMQGKPARDPLDMEKARFFEMSFLPEDRIMR